MADTHRMMDDDCGASACDKCDKEGLPREPPKGEELLVSETGVEESLLWKPPRGAAPKQD